MPTPAKQQIQKLITQLETDLNKLIQLPDYSYIKLRPHSPASDREIAAYEKYLGIPLPVSYRAFLELHNGYDGLAYPGDMLSIRDVMPKGKWYERIKEWKKRTAEFGSGEVLDGIVIANLGQPNNWAYLDPNRPSKKSELTVVEKQPDYSADYDTVAEFLKECLETCRVGLKEAAGEIDETEDGEDE